MNNYGFPCGTDPSGCFLALVLLSKQALLNIHVGSWELSSLQLKDPQAVVRLIEMRIDSTVIPVTVL